MGHGLREAVGHGWDLQLGDGAISRVRERDRLEVVHGCERRWVTVAIPRSTKPRREAPDRRSLSSPRSPRSAKPRREAHRAAQPPRREAHREAQWPDRRSPVRERERAETESRVQTWEGEARVFWKMVYGKIFRKPFSLFSSVIFRSICIRFSLTSVLQHPKRPKVLKTFYFQTNGT